MGTSLESFPIMLMFLLMMIKQLTIMDCNAKRLCSRRNTVYVEKGKCGKQELGGTYVRSGSKRGAGGFFSFL